MAPDSVTISIDGDNNDSKFLLSSNYGTIGNTTPIVKSSPEPSPEPSSESSPEQVVDNTALVDTSYNGVRLNPSPAVYTPLGGNVNVIQRINEEVLEGMKTIGTTGLEAERSMPGYIVGCENYCLRVLHHKNGDLFDASGGVRVFNMVACPAIWQSKEAGSQWGKACEPLFAAFQSLPPGVSFELTSDLGLDDYVEDKEKFAQEFTVQNNFILDMANIAGVAGDIIAGADGFMKKFVLDPSSISPSPDGLNDADKAELWYDISDVITLQFLRIPHRCSMRNQIVTEIAKELMIDSSLNLSNKWFLSHNPNRYIVDIAGGFKQTYTEEDELCLMQWDQSAVYCKKFQDLHAKYYRIDTNSGGITEKLIESQCMTINFTDVSLATFDFSGNVSTYENTAEPMSQEEYAMEAATLAAIKQMMAAQAAAAAGGGSASSM